LIGAKEGGAPSPILWTDEKGVKSTEKPIPSIDRSWESDKYSACPAPK